jgi:hypothetical protein
MIKLPLLTLIFIAILASLSCSKAVTKPEPLPPGQGPWDGVYTMTATQTTREDTSDLTPYGGGKIITRSETSTGSTFTGSLLISKDHFLLQNLAYQESTTGEEKEFDEGTGNTSTEALNRSIYIPPTNIQSTYTVLQGSDSVLIPEAVSIARVINGTPVKLKYSFNGTFLVFNSSYYLNSSQSESGTMMDRKIFYRTTTVYQKQ